MATVKAPVYLAGAGAVTAAGLNARQTLAAIRAGLSAFNEIVVEPFPATQIAARVPTTWKLRKTDGEWLVNMAVRAIMEALRSGPFAAAATALVISPPESFRSHPAFATVPFVDFLPAVMLGCGGSFHPASIAVDGGAAASVSLLERASDLLSRPGVEQIILGGVDSFLNDVDLDRLRQSGRLKSSDGAQGLVPGEAAAFVRLTSAPEGNGAVAPAVVNIGVAREEDSVLSDRFSQGRAMLSALRAAVASNGPKESDISFVVSNSNGERHRALEQLVVHPRFYRTLRELTPTAYPAMTVGEVGAAAGALALMLAADGMRQNYAPGSAAMLEIASETGLRTAAVVAGMRRR
ncbi:MULTISPECIES: hypothetical protein [unclassified Mesorhizobium]|uniref:hypothetical protein n=1 Tax=unclassified Mesorhizobium TaxID=325217 RepID=UPI001CCB8946|nr:MULTISPECIES: hypothetical protein [unclassified Mesorhizobium]MBZ9920874.1 hypothetical protein [Mesorhizobium sp. BR1-1-7]MBZ9954483.1 hypothetical protein [Mesorhizobium sp. BR1-1-15]MBZ9971552.1 hypothetical protein [Mesorhizobium sp. BR1-1-12]